MDNLNREERILLCLYGAGERRGTIAALEEMRGYLEPEEAELRSLTEGVMAKLTEMSDEGFAALDLYSDMGGFAHGG